ncbi:hypothetical protein EVAR_6982_1 [Eumeta japonica]|uniref:Uncharacterized protein n=1 Tax=Eumeta variegata TaxID=151549 RepID=A0A4C1THP3_EUMVA|nr:hypothetical protein EVAR_6982_1 [Eumeta japonica]
MKVVQDSGWEDLPQDGRTARVAGHRRRWSTTVPVGNLGRRPTASGGRSSAETNELRRGKDESLRSNCVTTTCIFWGDTALPPRVPLMLAAPLLGNAALSTSSRFKGFFANGQFNRRSIGLSAEDEPRQAFEFLKQHSGRRLEKDARVAFPVRRRHFESRPSGVYFKAPRSKGMAVNQSSADPSADL